jgi:glycosyltransferase involved in cell wall biosynthesis
MPLDIEDNEVVNYRKKLDLEGKKVIVQIGSLCDRKNQLDTVKMMIPLLKENRNIVFILVGGIINHEYSNLIFNLCKNEDIDKQVLYLGELAPGNILNIIYNIADASIFNSKSEGFSLVILESLSAGTPVLINSTFFNQMDMLNDSNGIITFDSSECLYNKINNEIINTENRLKYSQQARLFIEKNYSWDAISKLYLDNILN